MPNAWEILRSKGISRGGPKIQTVESIIGDEGGVLKQPWRPTKPVVQRTLPAGSGSLRSPRRQPRSRGFPRSGIRPVVYDGLLSLSALADSAKAEQREA